MRTLLIAAILAVATPTLATPVQAPETSAPSGRLIIDGATWRCEGDSCTATGGANQPATRACRRVVARLGEVTAFTWKGTALSAEELAACNA